MNVLYTARFLRYFYVGLVNLSSSVNAMLMFLYYEYPIKNTWEREKKKKKADFSQITGERRRVGGKPW